MMKNYKGKPTLLGNVKDVNGTNIRVKLDDLTLSGLVFVNGEGYRIGQIGSFVRIPIGYSELFGIVSQVGASAVPENHLDEFPHGDRWLNVQLIGEALKRGNFQRGISQYPTIDDEVHLISEQDLAKIYGQKNKGHFVKIGHISGSESIDALLDINKLVTRHSAILGSTGTGKSTTVASILNALSNHKKYPSSRIIVLDIHGEYGSALSDKANIFKINPDKNSKTEEVKLQLPYWALNFDELIELAFGDFGENTKQRNIILEEIIKLKEQTFKSYPKVGIDIENINVDTPIPFSIHKLWYDLYCRDFGTYYSEKKEPKEENWAFEVDEMGKALKGDALKGIPPRFKNVKNIKGDDEKINYLPDPLNMRKQLENLGAKLRIPRFDFLLNPGQWRPNLDGHVGKDLDELMKQWIGSNKPISILDLSGVPITILNSVIGILLRILFDALFWSRNLSQGGKHRPILIVMEEAHAYLNENSNGIASSTVQRIVKEGRKYGIGALIVSQRPSEIDSTILSQCGTIFALRLSNSTDRSHITGAMSENLEGLTNMLPILRTGEAIIIGEAVKLPMRTNVTAPPKDRRPDSQDPIVFDEVQSENSMYPAGWGIDMEKDPNYQEFLIAWRQQNSNIVEIIKEKKRESNKNKTNVKKNNKSKE